MVAPEVAAALARGGPVVGLETAVLTHGLPRPQNLHVVRAMAAAVRRAGATPAVIGALAGVVRVGLDDDALATLAAAAAPKKLGARDLAWAIAAKASGGTTVSATLACCSAAGIRVIATGGIGGVHRDTAQRDVSADLYELSQSTCCVVCSGGKSILDLPATLEALESLGVPVIGWRTDHLPQFHARGDARLPAPRRLDAIEQVVALCRARWGPLAQRGGLLLANPAPAAAALDQAELDAVVAAACQRARERGIQGAALTPFLLADLEDRTDGRSLRANLALLEDNARLAGELAAALAVAP
ncbi:MAG: pseudouridine-5'-phosphate glycosidase [Myxococcales bacterium]|nr:pseudouridine-5'-phosphate glycosidase [Myxococcales bacterium]